MNNPKVSVIVPVYNTEKYLHRCIDSILAQTFTDFELLLIDDGSKDSSGAICDEYAVKDSRVRVFHKENGGVSSARNIGLDNAQGEWIAIFDSDDWVSERMLQKMYEAVLFNNAEIAYCDINMVFSQSQKVWKAAQYNPSKVILLNESIASVWTSLCNLLIKRELFEVNKLRCPVDIHFAEDYHLATRLMFYANKISYVPEPFYCYNRMNEGSALHNFTSNHYDKERWVNKDVIEFFKNEDAYNDYAQPLNWRLLKSLQEFVLDKATYSNFLSSIYPDTHKYIFSCPYINVKIKIMMWALTHNLRFISELFLIVRGVKEKVLRIFK